MRRIPLYSGGTGGTIERRRVFVTSLGLVLLVLGAAAAVAEAHVVSYGVLGTAAVAALATGLALIVGGAGGGVTVAIVPAWPRRRRGRLPRARRRPGRWRPGGRRCAVDRWA